MARSRTALMDSTAIGSREAALRVAFAALENPRSILVQYRFGCDTPVYFFQLGRPAQLQPYVAQRQKTEAIELTLERLGKPLNDDRKQGLRTLRLAELDALISALDGEKDGVKAQSAVVKAIADANMRLIVQEKAVWDSIKK